MRDNLRIIDLAYNLGLIATFHAETKMGVPCCGTSIMHPPKISHFHIHFSKSKFSTYMHKKIIYDFFY